MAAAGSSDFQIEREANKSSSSREIRGIDGPVRLDGSRRFAYELEVTQEVKDMSFAIDTAQPAAAPAPVSKPVLETDTDQFADVVLTRALMGAEEIKQRNARKAKSQVSVRVNGCFARKALSISTTRSRTTATFSIV